MIYTNPIILIVFALIASSIAIFVIGVIIWALLTHKDESYKTKQAEFYQRKSRVEKRIQESRKNGI